MAERAQHMVKALFFSIISTAVVVTALAGCASDARGAPPPANRADVAPPEPRRPAAVASEPSSRVTIPAGTFNMGDRRARRVVTLSAFAIDRYEVTVAEYAACVAAERCTPPNVAECIRPQHATWGVAGKERHPMTCITWTDARDYCAFAGGRLPTEAEWEYAARGTDGRRYVWGNESPDRTRANYNYMHGGTTPVGEFPNGASAFGALDMAGNVWEWVADYYGPLARGSFTNPRGPDSGNERVARGGAWNCICDEHYFDAYYRPYFMPPFATSDLGARCAYESR